MSPYHAIEDHEQHPNEAIEIQFTTEELSIPPVTDTYEPNDLPGAAHDISVGDLYESYISIESDIDYYRFTSDKTAIMKVSFSSPVERHYRYAVYVTSLTIHVLHTGTMCETA